MARVNLTFPKLDGNGPFSVGRLPSCRSSCKVEFTIFNEPTLRVTTDFRFVHTNAEGEKMYLVIPIDLLTITSEDQARLVMEEINKQLSVWDDVIPHTRNAIDTLSSSEYALRYDLKVRNNKRDDVEAEIARAMLRDIQPTGDRLYKVPIGWAEVPDDSYQRLKVAISTSQSSASPQTSTAVSKKPEPQPPAAPALIRKVGLSKEDLRRTGARQRSAYDAFERGV